jgi:phage shock protein E
MKSVCPLVLTGVLMAAPSCAKDVGEAAGPPPSTRVDPASVPMTKRLPDKDIPLAKRLIAEERAIVLDVRSLEEWDTGHLEGAILVPHTELASRMDEVVDAAGGEFGRPVVIYCRSGRRADLARTALEAQGFTKVTNAGGLVDLCPECVQTAP